MPRTKKNATQSSVTFALRAPARDDKPVTQKRKAAFDVAPKKQAPKPVFSTKSIAEKVNGSNTAEPSTAPDVSLTTASARERDSLFVAWLRSGNGDRPGFAEAREYLMRGPPYRGASQFTAKEAIKELGGKWVANPLKQKGVKDGVTPGWWSATSERDLESLVSMPVGKNGRRQWTAVDVPDKSHRAIVGLMREYESWQRREDATQQATQQARLSIEADRLAERETLRRQRECASGIPESSEEDICSLRENHGVEFTSDMGIAASKAAVLGPHAHISSARRLERALKLKIVSPEQARNHLFVDHLRAVKRHSPEPVSAAVDANGNNANDNDKHTTSDERIGRIDYRKAKLNGPSTGCFMFGRQTHMIALPSDHGWEQIANQIYKTDCCAKVSSDHTKPGKRHRRTWCVTCGDEVLEQFDECACVADDNSSNWRWCGVCHAACHDTLQGCRCKGDVEWDRRQNIAVRAQREAFEKAAAYLIASAGATVATGPGASSSNAKAVGMTWSDDDDC